jgi:hypothetical protein
MKPPPQLRNNPCARYLDEQLLELARAYRAQCVAITYATCGRCGDALLGESETTRGVCVYCAGLA